MRRVCVLAKMHPDALARLREHFDVVYEPGCEQGDVASLVEGAEAVIVRSRPRIDRRVISRAEGLRYIGRAGVGIDNIDVNAAEERGIRVENTPRATSRSVAEHAFALMLTACHNTAHGDRSLREGRWMKSSLVGTELSGKTVGIIGFGNIGYTLARMVKGFGCKVLAYDVMDISARAGSVGAEPVDLEVLLASSDIISIHVPLLEGTKGMITARELGIMKRSAVLVNTSRGGIVHEGDLYEALKKGRIRYACLDVFEREPPEGSPLLTLDNVVLTPHIAASTVEAQRRAGIELAERLVEFFAAEEKD